MREFENPTIEVTPIDVADEVTTNLSGFINPTPGGNGGPII